MYRQRLAVLLLTLFHLAPWDGQRQILAQGNGSGDEVTRLLFVFDASSSVPGVAQSTDRSARTTVLFDASTTHAAWPTRLLDTIITASSARVE